MCAPSPSQWHTGLQELGCSRAVGLSAWRGAQVGTQRGAGAVHRGCEVGTWGTAAGTRPQPLPLVSGAGVSQRHRHTSDKTGCQTKTEKSFPAGDGKKLRGCDERRCPHAAPRCWHRSPAVPSPCPGPAGHWQSPPAKNCKCKNFNRNQALLMTKKLRSGYLKGSVLYPLNAVNVEY